ncbi:MAG: hypothetical protein AB7G13_20925 [Lautropia sp.]
MNRQQTRSPRQDWLSRTLAGLVAGLVIGFAVAGLFLHLMPGNTMNAGRYFVSRWIVIPVWLSVLSLVYLFRDGRRAWTVLGVAALSGMAALLACRTFLR